MSAVVSSCLLSRQSCPVPPPWAAIGARNDNCRPPPAPSIGIESRPSHSHVPHPLFHRHGRIASVDSGLTIVDNFTRESLAIEVAASIGGQGVVEVLHRLMQRRRMPKTIRVDNGPEFTSKRLDQWTYLNGVELDFSRPGKPTDNAFIEAFNGRFRQECLNENWFLSLEDAVEKVENLAKALQWGETPQRAGEPVASGVRRTGYIGGLTRKTLTQTGTGNGARPCGPRLTFSLDQLLGGRPQRL